MSRAGAEPNADDVRPRARLEAERPRELPRDQRPALRGRTAASSSANGSPRWSTISHRPSGTIVWTPEDSAPAPVRRNQKRCTMRSSGGGGESSR
jgi:hypothetical protein